MTTPKNTSSERKTIAVFGAQLNRVWGSEFMEGVLNSARSQDVNVVYFVGGKPVALAAPTFEGRSYGLYDLIKPGKFDGIILSADMGHGPSAEDVKNFCLSFTPMPIVSFSVPVEGVSAIMADNDGGMRSVIRHLIEEHGYKRIAFLRGPHGQLEAEQRFNAYMAELKAHDIRFDEHLVLEGDNSTESGRAAVRTLLDERGSIQVQAIAASNDYMAFGILEQLQQRGVRVPDQIAITGFDDVSDAQSMSVPLTTVHQSFYQAGQLVFNTLQKRMEGEKVGELSTLPSDLIVRWSCGCLPESIKKAAALPKEVAQTARLENKREAAIRALFGAAGISETDPARDQYVDVFGRTWNVFLACLRTSDPSDAFLNMIQTTMEVLQRNGYGFNVWHNVLSTFRKYALSGISSNTTMLQAENLFQQARILVGELSQRAQAYRRMQSEQKEERLNNFSFSMAPAMSLEEIGDAISKHFPLLGLQRWYVMFYSDVSTPGSISSPPPESYRLLLQYDEKKFHIPREKTSLGTGRLTPRGKTPEGRRYDAVVMPLALASNRFGFMWVEMGPDDWDIYVRLKNLLSSALLRTMLVQQREHVKKEVERLLGEARERAVELARARDVAEKAAAQNAKLFESEQNRRRAAEALARSSRHLSSLTTIEKIPQQILEQLKQVLPYDRAILFMEDVNGQPHIRAHYGMPDNVNLEEFQLKTGDLDFYEAVVQKGETLLISDVNKVNGWSQTAWLPRDRSWLGAPFYSKDSVVGLLALGRSAHSFSEDDNLLVTTFAMQAIVALENARLYDEVTGMNQIMERMVAQRVEELNKAYNSLAQHDKNKSSFIQVAAHELRTPLTVIKGYLGMLKEDSIIHDTPALMQAIEGVMKGANRLHQIVNSMLDVVRLENQIVSPHVETVSLGLILRLIQKDYTEDLTLRNLTFEMDDAIKDIPPLRADSELLKKALDHVIVNAIKFTPDGGKITVSANIVEDSSQGEMAEIRVTDTGIGIDPEHHKIIFEKLYQLGKVELHSSSRTNYKGGGAGLGLAIAAGIVKAFQGNIWVESDGHDEVRFPGSVFFIRLPLAK